MIIILILFIPLIIGTCFYQTYLGIYKNWRKATIIFLLSLIFPVLFYRDFSHLQLTIRDLFIGLFPSFLIGLFFLIGFIYSKIIDYLNQDS